MARKAVTAAGFYGGRFLPVGSSYESVGDPRVEAAGHAVRPQAPGKMRGRAGEAKPKSDSGQSDGGS